MMEYGVPDTALGRSPIEDKTRLVDDLHQEFKPGKGKASLIALYLQQR